MKHYLSTLESSMKSGWDRPALCNYRGEIFTNAGLAAEIVKFDLVFSEFGIKKGDKIFVVVKDTKKQKVNVLNANGKKIVKINKSQWLNVKD